MDDCDITSFGLAGTKVEMRKFLEDFIELGKLGWFSVVGWTTHRISNLDLNFWLLVAFIGIRLYDGLVED